MNRIRTLSGRTVYEDEYMRLQRDQVEFPGGRQGAYATVTIKPGSSVLPLTEEGEVYLIREYKYALAAYSIETVGGGIEVGETPLQAAQRELREEAGIVARQWSSMGWVNPLTSLLNCPIHLFVAKGLEHVQHDREDGEAIEVVKYPFEEALRMVMNGEVTHAPTCVLLLKAHATLSPTT